MNRYTLLVLLLFLNFALLAQTRHEVTANSNNTFTPNELSIELGDTVVWTNSGGNHNVNGTTNTFPNNPEGFGNGIASTSAWTYEFVFNQPGTYSYQCDPHAFVGMNGTITVSEPVTPAEGIVISEIMYNPPESGADSLEFIELYNSSDVAADLTGYFFPMGVTATIPDTILEPGAYLVVAVNPLAIQNQFGVSAIAFTGALSNGGELIQFADPAGNVVAEVAYDSDGTWPAAADAGGASLVFCDATADPADPANWAASTTDAGIIINGIAVFASPGAADACLPPGSTTYPPYSIGLVNTVDADGVADSIGVTTELQGIVYGVNIRPGGLQFTLIDTDGDGIGVFSDAEDFGYTVQEGDEVTVRGTISQFNGLTQIGLDTIERLSSGNVLLDPTVVTELGEATESQLVTLENVSLVDPMEWGDGSNSFNVSVTDGSSTFTVRIDSDVDIAGTAAPEGAFNVTGLGGQFDGDAPFTEGYQLLPRYMSDIQTVSQTVDPALARLVELYPNPAQNYLQLKLSDRFDAVRLHNAYGQEVWQKFDPQFDEQLDVSGLPSGMYTLTFVRGQRIWSTQILKQ